MIEERMIIRLPMPPHGVNMATEPTHHGGRRKVPESRAWEEGIAILLGGWTPPAQTPLEVIITLEFPKKLFRTVDADKWAAVVSDAVIGARRDQWIDRQISIKTIGEGWATVEVTWCHE